MLRHVLVIQCLGWSMLSGHNWQFKIKVHYSCWQFGLAISSHLHIYLDMVNVCNGQVWWQGIPQGRGECPHMKHWAEGIMGPHRTAYWFNLALVNVDVDPISIFYSVSCHEVSYHWVTKSQPHVGHRWWGRPGFTMQVLSQERDDIGCATSSSSSTQLRETV